MKTTLKHAKDTKGTYVYKNDEDDAPIPSLYIKKASINSDSPPKTITITIPEIK